MAPTDHTLDSASPSGNLVEPHYYVAGLGFGHSTLLVFLRLFHRYRSGRLGWDDCFLLSSWTFSAAMQIPMLYAIWLETMCYHRDHILPENFKVYSELSYVAAPMFMLSIGCAKMSILFLYRRLGSCEEPFKLAIHVSMGAVSVTTLTITVLLFFARPGTSSIDAVALFLATASSSIVMDIVLLVLPIRMIYQIQMPLKEKLLVTAFFSLGLITTSISIVRLVLLNRLQGSSDLTWDAAPANITSFLEVNLHAICACLSEVRRFFRDIKWDKFRFPWRTDPSQAPEAHPLPFGNSSQDQLQVDDETMELGLVQPRSVSTAGTGSQPKEWWTQ